MLQLASSGPTFDSTLACAKPVLKRYILQDEQMSVYAQTNEVASVTEGYEYDPYGRALVYLPATVGGSVGFTAADNIHDGDWATFHHLYTGRNYDAESSLLYYRSRYLDSHLGRFISKDTIGVWGDKSNNGNAFAYVNDSPLTRTDSSGMGWGWCLKFYDCQDSRPVHVVNISALNVEGNNPDLNCERMKWDILNGLGIVASATNLRLDVNVTCLGTVNLGVATDKLQDSCEVATKASYKATGDAWVSFMSWGNRNGCAQGKGFSVAQDSGGLDWANEIIIAHEFSHTRGAREFGHSGDPSTSEMLLSCFNHMGHSSFMNYCDAKLGTTSIDPGNRAIIRGSFGESWTT